MNIATPVNFYSSHPSLQKICSILLSPREFISTPQRIHVTGLCGSSLSFVIAAIFEKNPVTHLVVANDKEEAVFLLNDMENIIASKNISYFPATYKKTYSPLEADSGNIQLRTGVLAALANYTQRHIIVTYPEALCGKIVSKDVFAKNSLLLKINESYAMDFITDLLDEYGFSLHEFASEPGQYAVRGCMVDIFSFSSEHPYRFEFSGERIEKIRYFHADTQLSFREMEDAVIIPGKEYFEKNEPQAGGLIDYLPGHSVVWAKNFSYAADKIIFENSRLNEIIESGMKGDGNDEYPVHAHFLSKNEFQLSLERHHLINLGSVEMSAPTETIGFDTNPQPSFNKNFDLLKQNLSDNKKKGFTNIIVSDTPRQIQRLYAIFDDLLQKDNEKPVEQGVPPSIALTTPDLFTTKKLELHEGFIDNHLKIACYTDHQIFDRYHRFHLKEGFQKAKQTVLIKELKNLKPGDYVVHIDHGIGQFAGLEKIDVNGKMQETIRILYRDNDLLNVSIHSLHRISKYSGKDGSVPRIDKLGSNTWKNLKQKTKRKIKELAFDLIKLYARRKSEKGTSFSPDTYLQTELEASFIYEDTSDQVKATRDVKRDMENESPMERLICGDVGFGKTEIAIRAACKAIADGKQVAVLAPTTILALQHYKTFSDRLINFPCKIEYINRFKNQKSQKEILKNLEAGKMDILIGTHRLLGKDVKFKDLGLLVIDEEQKFGVSAKETIKALKINVDTLTLSATPIPRTLQLSLLGARDMSVLNTPPPNRYPVQTEVHAFNERIIRDAITDELERGGQVFFVHNRIRNIHQVAILVRKLCPTARVVVAHGRMHGRELEEIMVDFIDGETDVLLSTAIIESGIDIPNANTMIINDAHRFGLSDLHQLRGRVGRSNKKSFCYLLTPPFLTISDEAKKRMKALEDFSELGSGFNIALRDLDIRGAGNLLGAEQSGFINDMGIETYQKIMNEAVAEIKFEMAAQENSAELQKPDGTDVHFTSDCIVDTDLEILIPDHYISDISERLAIYREISEMDKENAFAGIREKLIDRFGPIPPATEELFHIVHLRQLGKKTGFEKIILKNGCLTGYFPSHQESPFYRGEIFNRILSFLQGKGGMRLRENKNKLSLSVEKINTVTEALQFVNSLYHWTKNREKKEIPATAGCQPED